MYHLTTRKCWVALLVLGSAILLFSCESKTTIAARKSESAMMTELSEDLSIVMSQNGRRSYFFETPLLEGYTLGAEPYREFRKGIKITTYQDDSLSKVDMVLTANYAIYYEQRELWEAKGDVVGRKFDGKQLYTQQLFWDARTQKIYSNVDTKLVQGNNVSVGESFEANEDLSDWRFRYQKSRIEVEFEPTEGGNSTASASRTRPRTEGRDSDRPVAVKPSNRADKRPSAPKREVVIEPHSESQPALRSNRLATPAQRTMSTQLEKSPATLAEPKRATKLQSDAELR